MQMHFRPKQRAPNELGGVKIPYVGTRGKRHKIAWYLILFAVLSPILLLLSGVVGSWLTLTANGTVFLEQQEIRAARAGRISQLNVAAGDVVKSGETLAALDNLELDSAAARNAVERQAAAAARRSVAAQGAAGALSAGSPRHNCQSGARGGGDGRRTHRGRVGGRGSRSGATADACGCCTRPGRQYCRGRSRLARERATFNDPYIALRWPRPRYSGQAGGVRVPWRAVDGSGADRQPARGRLRVSEVRKSAESRHDSNDPFSGRNADTGTRSGAADTHAAHACGPRGPVRAAPDDGGTESPAEGEAERQPAGSGVTGIGTLPLRLGVVRNRRCCWGTAR